MNPYNLCNITYDLFCEKWEVHLKGFKYKIEILF